jgi:hypothetical protein
VDNGNTKTAETLAYKAVEQEQGGVVKLILKQNVVKCQ